MPITIRKTLSMLNENQQAMLLTSDHDSSIQHMQVGKPGPMLKLHAKEWAITKLCELY